MALAGLTVRSFDTPFHALLEMQEGRVHSRLRDSVPISGLSLFSFRVFPDRRCSSGG
jgi:hypothetical protein